MFQLPAPAREPAAWMHAPPQPLVRSPLSRCQTPTAPRRAVGFFGSGCPPGLPAGHFARLTSDWPVLFCQPFQPSTHAKIKARLQPVNARFWCNCGNPADKLCPDLLPRALPLGALCLSVVRKKKKQRTYTSTSGTSICPLRNAATNASTTCGSKSLPEPFMITSLASNGDIALRYGRSLVSES